MSKSIIIGRIAYFTMYLTLALVGAKPALAEDCKIPSGEIQYELSAEDKKIVDKISDDGGETWREKTEEEKQIAPLRTFVVPNADCKSARLYQTMGDTSAPTDEECQQMAGADFGNTSLISCIDYPLVKNKAKSDKSKSPSAYFDSKGDLITKNPNSIAGPLVNRIQAQKDGKITARFEVETPKDAQKSEGDLVVDYLVSALKKAATTPEGKRLVELAKKNKPLLKLYAERLLKDDNIDIEFLLAQFSMLSNSAEGKRLIELVKTNEDTIKLYYKTVIKPQIEAQRKKASVVAKEYRSLKKEIKKKEQELKALEEDCPDCGVAKPLN